MIIVDRKNYHAEINIFIFESPVWSKSEEGEL